MALRGGAFDHSGIAMRWNGRIAACNERKGITADRTLDSDELQKDDGADGTGETQDSKIRIGGVEVGGDAGRGQYDVRTDDRHRQDRRAVAINWSVRRHCTLIALDNEQRSRRSRDFARTTPESICRGLKEKPIA